MFLNILYKLEMFFCGFPSVLLCVFSILFNWAIFPQPRKRPEAIQKNPEACVFQCPRAPGNKPNGPYIYIYIYYCFWTPLYNCSNMRLSQWTNFEYLKFWVWFDVACRSKDKCFAWRCVHWWFVLRFRKWCLQGDACRSFSWYCL